MCIAALAVPLAIAGTAVSAGSSIMGGYQQAAQARFAAAQADQNAQLAKNQAAQVQQQGEIDARNQQRKVAAVEGAQTVGFAASGLDVGFGTPTDVVSGTAQLGEEDVQRLRLNTQNRVQQFQIEAGNYTDTASADRSAASNAVTNGWLKAGGTVLSGASQVSGLGRSIPKSGSGSVFSGGASSGYTGSNMTGLY